MTLPNQNSRMVNALCKAEFEYLGLQATLQEVLNLKSEHVIETHARLVEHTNAHKTTNECIALEQTLRVLVIELQQLTSGTTNF
jgi:hypothetical protein